MDVKLEAKRVQPWYVGSEEDAPIGQIVTWMTHSTAIIAPGQKIDSYIRYGEGIDEVTEIIRLGIDTGFITKAGSWLTCSFMEDHLKELGVKEWDDDAKKLCRVQGQENMKGLLTDNPSWFDILDSEIKIFKKRTSCAKQFRLRNCFVNRVKITESAIQRGFNDSI